SAPDVCVPARDLELTDMILNVQVPGAWPYEIGDEIWQQSLAEAIRAEAEIIADDASSHQPNAPVSAGRDALRDRVIAEMTAALRRPGDAYTAPDGVSYALTDQPAVDPDPPDGRLASREPAKPDPVVEQVLRFEALPVGSPGSRRAVVRWSD